MRSAPIYEVHAVKYAHLPRKAWEVQITPDPHDADFPMDYFVWVAIPIDESGHRTIGGKPIVIDTGFNAAVGKKRGREVKTNPADLLEHLGVDAKEVEDVIVTHLHYDHIGNWDRFPKARFHVQDRRSDSTPEAMSRIVSCAWSVPEASRTYTMTPLYES